LSALREENARLKGLKGKPDIKPSQPARPSGMDKETDHALPRKERRAKKRNKAANPLAVHEDRIIKADHVPAGSCFKGFETYSVHEIRIDVRVVHYRRERWVTAEGRTVIAPLPPEVGDHFGPDLKRFILAQYHQGQTTVPRLGEFLETLGLAISKRQVVRILTEGKEAFTSEAQDVLRAALGQAGWISVDDTGARHQGRNGYCTQIGNDHFTYFATTGSKSRENFLSLLRAGHGDYVLSGEAFAYMRQRHLSATVLAKLVGDPERRFADEKEWKALLDRLGITGMKVTPDPVLIATEGALWGGDPGPRIHEWDGLRWTPLAGQERTGS
jgi:hypothetical protein